MEAILVGELDLPPDRAAALLDLSLETLHLRWCGDYQRSEAEIGWLIAFVTGGPTGAGEN